MEIVLGGLVGVLMAASVWLMLSRDLVKFLFGLILIGNVANLVIFLAGGLTLGAPPLIGAEEPAGGYANALPQALVLTAIVIGFALVSFTLILAMRAWQALGTTDVDEMVIAERRGAYTWVAGDRLGSVRSASDEPSERPDDEPGDRPVDRPDGEPGDGAGGGAGSDAGARS